MRQKVEVPAELFDKLLRASEALDELRDTFEDFLVSSNPSLLRRLRKARKEHLAGKTRPLEEFELELSRG